MTQTPMEANVVLTADVGQYQQSMDQAAGSTQQVVGAVDTLTQKLGNLAKSSGRMAMGFGAKEVATITAATAAYAAYERQMTSLSVQAATLNRTMDAQNRVFSSYSASVNALRDNFGTTTREAAGLVETLSRISDRTAPIDKMADSFTRLSMATGESSSTLASGMMQLQRTMGTPNRDIEKMNNQLLVLSKNSGASAEQILSFANNIAPIGRLVGITQTDVQSFSSAFIRAGQDGYRASQSFQRIMSDIAYSAQSGSPNLAKYANLVGMTVGQFKQMGGTDQFLNIFEAINRQGPRAITTLNQMGLDGMNTVRTITAMSQQSGGLQAAISQGRNADPNALNRGSNAAARGIADELTKVRSEVTMTAEAVGRNFAGPARIFTNSLQAMAEGVRHLAEGPLGKVSAFFTGTMASVALLGGALFTAAKGLAAFSAANLALRNSATSGFMEAIRRSPAERTAMLAGGQAAYGARVGQAGALGPVGARISREGNWVSRGLYTGAARAGLAAPAILAPGGTAPGLASRLTGYGLSGTAWGVRNFVTPQFTPGAMRLGMPGTIPFTNVRVPGSNALSISGTGGLTDYDRRWRMFESPTAAGSFDRFRQGYQGALAGSYNRIYGESAQLAHREIGERTVAATGSRMHQAMRGGSIDEFTRARDTHLRAQQAVEQSTTRLANAFNSANTNAMSATRGVGAFGRAMGNMTMVMAATAGGVARVGASLGRNLFALAGGNPLMAGLMTAGAGYMAYDAMKDKTEFNRQDYSGAMDAYLSASGRTGSPSFTGGYQYRAPTARTMDQATTVRQTDVRGARNPQHTLTNESLRGLDEGAVISTLAPTFSVISQDPAALQSLKLDLIDKFGPMGGQNILNRLTAGNTEGYGASYFAGQALNQPRRGPGPLNFLDPSREDISEQLSRARGVTQDRADLAYQYYGEKGGYAEQGRGLRDVFAKVAGRSNFDDAFRRGFRGTLAVEPGGVENEALVDFLKQAGMGESLDVEDLFGSRPAAMQNRSGEQRFRQFMKTYFTGQDMPGQIGVSQVDRQNFLMQMGLSPALASRPQAAYRRVMERIDTDYTAGGRLDTTDPLVRRIQRTVPQSREFIESGQVTRALEQPENVNAQILAVNQMLRSLQEAGNSAPQISRIFGNMRAAVRDPENPLYQLASAAQSQNLRAVGFQMPGMNRVQQFGAQTGMYRAAMGLNPGDPQQQQLMEQAEDTYAQQAEAQRQYFVGLLTQQREYEIMRGRAQEDYNQQRGYQEDDFQRQRAYAEEEYNISRDRAQLHFGIQMRRNQDDFHLSRQRQEEDFFHQRDLMIENSARTMMNIQQRIQVQRTNSAEYTLFNAGEQLQQMRTQSRQLDQLRRMGMTNRTISQLSLNDPNNAQQLNTIVGDAQRNPRLIARFNRAIQQRMKAAENLVTDESSTEWREFVRQYRLSRERAMDDFQRQVRRSRQDFAMNMEEMDTDFRRSMRHQADEFDIVMDRQEQAYDKTMNRAAEDLERSAKTIDGNFMDILTRATKKLSGHAKEQANAVIDQFQGLKQRAVPAMVDLMEALGLVVGVEYKTPRGVHAGASNRNNAGPGHQQGVVQDAGLAAGGTIPGWSPGFDNTTFVGPAGQKLHLAGGEAVMVPEFTRTVGEQGVKQLNKAARNGTLHQEMAFADGGLIPQSRIEAAKNFARSEVSPGNDYVWGGVGPNGYDCSGFMSAITNVLRGDVVHRRLGATSSFPWPGFVPGPGQFTIGSNPHYPGSGVGHMAGTLDGLNVESRGGEGPVVGSAARGYRDPGFISVYHLGHGGNYGYGGSAGGMTFGDITKDTYPSVEKYIANQMDALRPTRPGQFSKVMNHMLRKAFRALGGRKAMRAAQGAGGGDFGAGVPESVTDNVAIGRAMAANAGWTGQQWSDLYTLWSHESGWRTSADNPVSSAYGIPQALVDLHGIGKPYWGTKVGSGSGTTYHGGDAKTQINWGINYIKGRYGNPSNAWDYWRAHSSYARGGIFANGMKTINVAEHGPEMVLPLNDRGAEFIQSVMRRSQAGQEAKSTITSHYGQPLAHNLYQTYHVNKSTNFTGAITVQANNPNEFIQVLKQRQRTAALTRPLVGALA